MKFLVFDFFGPYGFRSPLTGRMLDALGGVAPKAVITAVQIDNISSTKNRLMEAFRKES